MTTPLKYHEGEIAVQKRADAFDPAELETNGLGVTFDSRSSPFVAEQTWAVIAALDGRGRIWTSVLHGPAGFLRVHDEKTLNVQASLPADDPLAQSFQNETEIGMLVLDPRIRRRLRINGRARSTERGALIVTTREVYNNCPKYIQRREVVDVVPTKPAEAMVTPSLEAEHRYRIARADTFFIGTIHAEAGVDCSHRGGNPGFVLARGGRHVIFPDYSGNNMFQTLGNLSLDSRAGLMFLDFETGDVLQLTGTATAIWDVERLRDWPGALRLIEFEVAEVIARRRALPLRWRFIDYSPANPG
jgi:predicted pyridoxine 5'-phosphate oxidase superfamily flavin-nucleotide-binding protein